MKDNEKDIIDYGEWTVPTSWDQITLKQYQEIEKLYGDKDKRFDVRECLHIFTNKSIDEINALPLEFVDSLMNNLVFLKDSPEEKEPTNKVIIDGEAYIINTQNKLKVGEYVASDAVLKSDPHNYAAILAVLARKAGEEYDSKFENEILEDRIKMFEQVPVTDVLALCSFFLTLYMASVIPSRLSSNIREGIDLTRNNIETSAKNGEISRHSMKSLMKKLRKLERSLDNI
jgi:hypothetical protein